jgi:hypothetical protein
MTPHQQSGGLEALKAKYIERAFSSHPNSQDRNCVGLGTLEEAIEEAYNLGRADRDEEVRGIVGNLEQEHHYNWSGINMDLINRDDLITALSPDVTKCEHDVNPKYCFRCKRPDLAGPVPDITKTEVSE